MLSLRARKRIVLVRPRASAEVLCYQLAPQSPSTVHRHYALWRQERGIPVRCDTPSCQFHTAPLTWLDRPFKPILDHKNGQRLDNNPENLRYVCPLCDAQLPTRGGKNRNRVIESAETRYSLAKEDGTQDERHLPPAGRLALEGHAPSIVISPTQASE